MEGDRHSTEWIIMADLIQCKLCCKALNNPRVLSNCKHIFCFECLWHWWQESADSDMTSVICPTCRAHCGLPTEGISALQSDIKISRHGHLLKQCVVVVNKEETPDTCPASATGPGASTPPCDICSMDTEKQDDDAPAGPALRYCEDCQNHLCDPCSVKHAQTSVFSRHKVKELGFKAKGSTKILCSKHPGKPLKYFCSSCPSVSCSVCVTTQHSQGHIVCEINEMVDQHKMEIRKLLEEVKMMSQGLDNRDAITEELVMRTKDAFWSVAKVVSDHADQCRKEIEEAEAHLLTEIETRKAVAIQRTREEGKKRNYSILDLETLQSYGNRLLTTASPLEFVGNCGELEDRMKTALQFRDNIKALKIKGLEVKFIPQQGLLSLGRLEDIVPTGAPTRVKPMLEKVQVKQVQAAEAESPRPTPPPKQQKPKQLAIEEPKLPPKLLAIEDKKPELEPAPIPMHVVVIPAVKHFLDGEDSKRKSSSNGSKTRSSSSSVDGSKTSSVEGSDTRLMPHSGRPRHRQHTRSSGHGSEKRSSSQVGRRTSAPCERARRYSAAYDQPKNRLRRTPRESALAVSTGDLLAFKEETQGSKLLWEARTMDSAEGEMSLPRDVGFLPNGDVYVLNDHFHNLVHFTQDGMQNHEVSNDFTSPMCLVMTRNGQPAITDSQEHSIKLFSLDGASYSVWKLENLMASGAAITRSGSWVVLDNIDDCFGVFPEPGSSCERLVPLGKHLLYTERYMACDSKGRIFVSGSEDSSVAVFDSEGNHLQDMGGAGSKGGYVSVPRGLYVDSRDNLVVADRHNHRVSMFSPDGRFIRHIVTCPFDKVVWPTGIDFMTTAQGQTCMALTISDNILQVYDVTDII